MSVGCDIIKRMRVQIYRFNEGGGWRWQGDLTFVTKEGNSHKRMWTMSGLRRPNDPAGCYQKVGRLYVVVYDTLEVHELQSRHKLPNQGSSNIFSERFHLIRLQGAISQDDRA